MTHDCPLDPTRDLFLERIIELPPQLIWKAWTTPELIIQWFTPAPWTTSDCEMDLRPGGIFRTTMRSPEGQDVINSGCYLEIIPEQKLVWTNSMEEGFRPASCPPDMFLFTAIICLKAHDKGTKYTARVVHQDEESCQRHNQMGFHEGWNAALDQLVALAKKL